MSRPKKAVIHYLKFQSYASDYKLQIPSAATGGGKGGKGKGAAAAAAARDVSTLTSQHNKNVNMCLYRFRNEWTSARLVLHNSKSDSSGQLKAGWPVQVRCTLLYDDGSVVDEQTTLTVTTAGASYGASSNPAMLTLGDKGFVDFQYQLKTLSSDPEHLER
jgi:hypothetical protein